MTIDSQKPKEWVRIASGPSCGFSIVHVLLLKGPTQLPYLLYLAHVSHTLPCLFNLAMP